MEINEMTLEQVEDRASEIDALFNAEDTSELNLEELRSEAEALKARKEELLEERKQIIEEIVEEKTQVEPVVIERTEDKKMERTLQNVLQSEEYVEAYARYLKTNKDTEVRALLTELVDNGVVPVPSYLEPRINTAWENEEVIARVSKSYIKGIIRQGIEVSATNAAFHTEGANAPEEEQIVIGVVTLVPSTLKKWITISDEVLDMTGRAFLDYVFDEIEYKIAHAASDHIVGKILNAPTSYVADADGKYTKAKVIAMNGEVAANTILVANSLLSDEARNPVVIMNKRTEAAFKALMTADGYLVRDPFDGLPVIRTSAMDSYAEADSGEIFAIVGDLSAMRVNFPNGQGIQFKFDELSLAEKDLNKIVGRMPIAAEIVASDRFVVIKKGNLSY